MANGKYKQVLEQIRQKITKRTQIAKQWLARCQCFSRNTNNASNLMPIPISHGTSKYTSESEEIKDQLFVKTNDLDKYRHIAWGRQRTFVSLYEAERCSITDQ